MKRGRSAFTLAVVGVVFALAANRAAAQGQNVRVVGQIGGACEAVQVVGNCAYIGEGLNLTILDVSNPSSPIRRGKVLLPDIVRGVYVTGGLAYVADGYYGLQIVAVSNPSLPQLRGSYNTPGDAYGVCVTAAAWPMSPTATAAFRS